MEPFGASIQERMVAQIIMLILTANFFLMQYITITYSSGMMLF